MTVTQTTFGAVTRVTRGTSIYATGDQLSDWARRGDNRWPCSVLARLKSVLVKFDAEGDLVDVEGAEGHDIPADELNAWASECLERAGYPTHPAIRPLRDNRTAWNVLHDATEGDVTNAEMDAVVEWCRDWANDCSWTDAGSEEIAALSDAEILRRCHAHIVGGLAFVLADVRRCAPRAHVPAYTSTQFVAYDDHFMEAALTRVVSDDESSVLAVVAVPEYDAENARQVVTVYTTPNVDATLEVEHRTPEQLAEMAPPSLIASYRPATDHVDTALTCPECGAKVWDRPKGSKLAKCWNADSHVSAAPLAFDTTTMPDDDDTEGAGILSETSSELHAALSREVANAVGLETVRASAYHTGGGCMVAEVDLSQDGRGIGRTLWLTRGTSAEDVWTLGVYDFAANDCDEGVCVDLTVTDANDAEEIAEAVAGIVRRLGVTLQG